VSAENNDTMKARILIGRRVVEQPLKIPFVAGAVLYANSEKSNVAEEVLGRAGPMCQEALDAGDWRSFKLLLRFLACLAPLYQEDGIVPILDELFNRAVDLQTASPEDVSQDRSTTKRSLTNAHR
jgi:nuclear cap-binding protein subunit 1